MKEKQSSKKARVLETSSKHAVIKKAVRNNKGETLKTKDIKQIVNKAAPTIAISGIQPSDHCENHSCKRCCECADKSNAIFKKIKHGVYKIL